MTASGSSAVFCPRASEPIPGSRNAAIALSRPATWSVSTPTWSALSVYLADISRSIVCPGRKPTAEQRKLYEIAPEQVLFNMELLRPGLSFREFADKCWPAPEAFAPNRYMMMVHGVGLADEYLCLAYAQDFAEWGYDGVFDENMVVSVESYIGEVGQKEGVKLEQQALITANGAEPMSKSLSMDAIEV